MAKLQNATGDASSDYRQLQAVCGKAAKRNRCCWKRGAQMLPARVVLLLVMAAVLQAGLDVADSAANEGHKCCSQGSQTFFYRTFFASTRHDLRISQR
jgi:hypothetical protein